MAAFIVLTPDQQNTSDPAQFTRITYAASLIAEVRNLGGQQSQIVFTDKRTMLTVRETFAEVNAKLDAK